MRPAPRSLNGATFLPTNWYDKDKEHLDSPFCIGDSVRVSKHECPKVVFTWSRDVQRSINICASTVDQSRAKIDNFRPIFRTKYMGKKYINSAFVTHL